MSDEKHRQDETEPNELVKDEFSDLLTLYDLENPTPKDIREVLEKHYESFGRVGFASKVDEATVNTFYTHFAKNSHEYLTAEKQFIQELLATDLHDVVEQGLRRSYALVPNQEYETPQAILLMNTRRTDAKVLGNGQFGINLQNLFSKVYSKRDNSFDIKEAREIILNNSAHEGTHVLVEQIEHTEKDRVNWAVMGAFNEGLATFAETETHYPWSDDYLRDSAETLAVIKHLMPDLKGAQRIELLQDICNIPSLAKYKPEELEKARHLVDGGNLSTEDFEDMAFELLVSRNGPLYYAGYAVWKKIYETEGIDKVKEIVKRGPKAYAEYI